MTARLVRQAVEPCRRSSVKAVPYGKGGVRALNRRGSRSDSSPRVAKRRAFADPTACERCGAIFFHKAWRMGRKIDPELLLRAAWDVCPACRQLERGEFYGRVVLEGPLLDLQEEAILRRIDKVAARAEFTQPERRIVEIRRRGDGVEVRTTSQKLAHRIVRELEKAFGGRGRFSWSDRDGRLYGAWRTRAG
jgi:NMD protein affecting ribosome stability and mRNA decay